MNLSSKKLYEFGPYRLDKQKRQLWRDCQVVPLTSKAMEILVILVDRAGEVVPKHELIEELWPDSYVEEANLTQNIFLLRKALGETSHDRRYIVTVPGRGYRFAADVLEVRSVNEVVTPAASPEPVPIPVTGIPPPDRLPVVRSAWLWIAVVVLLSVTSAAYLGRLLRSRTRPTGGRIVIAVLPFMNLTGDAAQDYFSDGLTEEMITQLGRLDPKRVGVIARTSVMRYKNGPEQLERIRRELRVDYVLEGSVRRDSGKVRITAQLIQMKDQTHLWAREYDREVTGLLVLQSAIAQEIADEIQGILGNHRRTAVAHQSSLSPSAYEAYELYLKGRYFANKRTPRGLKQAIECFQRAIAKDPTYSRAYAGLADSYVLMSAYSLFLPAEVMPKARAAAQHALELDDTLAEAHTSLALIAQDYDWDWQTAEKEYRRAIQLDANYATAHHWYAEHLALQARFDEAFAEIERARQLDPLSLIIATDHGAMLYFAREYERATAEFRSVLEMEPNFPRAHMLVFAYAQEGRFAEALADIESWRQVEDSPWRWSCLAYVYGRSGQEAKARQALAGLQLVYSQRHIDPAPMFVARIGMNNKDEALAWLQKGYLQHSSALTALKVDPIYDPLRGDPRFQELLRHVGLAQ